MSNGVDPTLLLARQIAAAAILREAGRIADSREEPSSLGRSMGKRIMPGDLAWAVEDYLRVLGEMGKNGI